MCSGTPTRREPGKFDFTGNNDLRHFIELCAKNGMKVILRPGPYVCAEWDMGGLPWWLLKDRDMKLRDDNPAFMETTPFGAWHGISLRPLVPTRPAITINGSAFCNSIDIQRLGDTNTASFSAQKQERQPFQGCLSCVEGNARLRLAAPPLLPVKKRSGQLHPKDSLVKPP